MHLFWPVTWLRLTMPFYQLWFGDEVLTRW